MKRGSIKPGGGIGFISLLMIFLTLCLVTFTALALSTAAADQNLTRRSADSVQNFYEAENQGQSFLCSLDLFLYEMQQHTQHDEEYFAWVQQRISSVLQDGFTFLPKQNSIHVELRSDERTLLQGVVQIEPLGSPQRYSVLFWRIGPIEEEYEEKFDNLWSGELL
jgi:hypothetical protein